VTKEVRSTVVSTRTSRSERTLIDALADLEQTTVSDLLHRLLMPVVRRRLRELTDESPRSEQ
jgi:uncharacterized protein (DUF1778 family)